MYEVNIRQYSPEGSFAAFASHLPRLQEMGVEVLWLMPVTSISVEKRQGSLGSYYACSSYTKVNPEFGTLDDLKALIDDAHRRGMKVIIDWVANHTGWDHHWTKEHPEWFYKNKHGEFFDKNGWVDVVDLDYSQPAMRREMIRAMQYWVNECDIDGFRCDMAHLVPLDFWMEARKALDKLKPLFWLAETDNNEYFDAFDASYAWSWMHKSEQFAKGHATIHEFTNELKKIGELPEDCFKLMFTSNHDENSWNGTEYEKYADAAKALAVLCATFRALPLVYSGQETPNKKRLRFFDKDEIEWGKPALHEFYRTLLQARKGSSALRQGSLQLLDAGSDHKLVAFTRKHGSEFFLVLVNLSGAEKTKISLHHPEFRGQFKSLFSGLSYPFDTTMEFELEPWGYLVYGKDVGHSHP